MHWDQGRTWTGDGVELVGLTPFVVDNLYEFTLEDGQAPWSGVTVS